MYSADEIIQMRANGHRAMWITFAFLLVAIPVAFGAVLYLNAPEVASEQGWFFLSIEGVVFGSFWLVAISSSLIKAYQKKPYVAASGGDGSLGHGDFGGD